MTGYDRNDRSTVDRLSYVVLCHVCPGNHTAAKLGLPRGTDRVPRYAARLIGSANYGGLWHCPEHADQTPDATQHGHHRNVERGPCGCPHGDWTEAPPSDDQVRRWAAWKEQRA